MILFEWHLSIIFLLIWKWYYPLLINTNNDTLWMLHLYLSLYSSICICICIPPCFNLFFNQFVKTKIKLHLWKRSNQPTCWFTWTDSQLNLEMASQCQCFRFAEVWLCRFDLLRSYHLFHCKKLIYQTKLFPAITLYQSRAHHWNKFSEVGNQRNNRGCFIYVSKFSYWKLFWAVGGILPGLMLCLPAMLANSPFLNLVILSPPNLVNSSLSKMVNLFVK